MEVFCDKNVHDACSTDTDLPGSTCSLTLLLSIFIMAAEPSNFLKYHVIISLTKTYSKTYSSPYHSNA